MTKSMTGYGKQTIEVGESRLHVEVRSVNHRFLDIAVKIPRTLLFLEDQMKRQVKNRLSRGRVDLFVTIEGESLFGKKITVDWPIVDQYIRKLDELKSRYDLTGEITIDMVSKLEEVFSVQEVEEDTGTLQNALLEAVDEAVKQVMQMRSVEGEQLHKDLRFRVTNIRHLLRELEERRPIVIEEFKERIRSRVEEYMKEQIHPDETRVLQEVALLAEKGDVTEELTRLESHLIQFASTLDRNEPIGRRLDFIVQEMHREVNTIGSKSNDGEVMEAVVNLKSEIEKMKEQVQNVE
ncbi:YicC/YloC family endoribonuclease [Halobacillus sp. H74]|uniref:YicC/YloC family endoribonuclease n=1 Tax=Halobacillus sp. H74 TaxID=3457436 RepID=UPI003FCE44A8